ncbi:MAG TPA: putative thioesterase [Cyanobacteria bacterium UBA11162]|nr:putative thioesterase [Cyanobacteria bacterium UBA12227]HAX88447.1 putative thioesterase [Cyanobacteria bacterium UBA11370]HBL12496.1 putative thioesterase [Cyanobacteria bacterium UBA11162]HBY79202.1 putative thioesterase [Cyanobacteria bacterium UBA11148]
MSTENPWISCPNPNPKAHLRFFCFPYAGAGASVFRTWSSQLPSDIEVFAIQLPGRENRLREPLFTHISDVIKVLIEVLPPYLDRPFAFFGHSMGALVSFDLARSLRRQHYPIPDYLFLSGRRAPQIPLPEPPLHQQVDDVLVEQLRRYNATPKAVLQSPEFMELLLPILRADWGINETYTYIPEAPLNCPISAFGGLHDEDVNYDELAAWCDHTTSTFTLRQFRGNHFYLKGEQKALLEAISQDLLGNSTS